MADEKVKSPTTAATAVLEKTPAIAKPAAVDSKLIDATKAVVAEKVKVAAPLQNLVFDNSVYGKITPSDPIKAKWDSLKNQKTAGGGNVQSYLGLAMRSTKLKSGAEAVVFERGIIVQRPNKQCFVVYGGIYLHYCTLDGMTGFLGLPTSDEEDGGNSSRRSRFDGGTIYWRGDTGPHEVHGAIAQRWEALGGVNGVLGMPISDEQPIKVNGKEIGRSQKFQGSGGGTIYWSSSTGAWEVYGDIRKVYEEMYNGPSGMFGLPTSGERDTPKKTGRYSDFKNGCLVWRGSPEKTYAFTKIEFYLDRFDTKGDDGFLRGDQDLYVKADISASSGEAYNHRMPGDGDYGKGQEIDKVLLSVPVTHGNTSVHVKLDGWDSDWPDDDDRLGTVDETYTVDNLWGTQEDPTHWRSDFNAVYRFRNPLPYDKTKFREQMYWGFKNFSTDDLSWKQYAATFRDVANDESVVWHPFDHAFYSWVYEDIAENGNCFGMCLESIYAQVGRSVFSEPLNRYPKDNSSINEINIKHGYQLGGGFIDWLVGQFIAGNTHDPVNCFNASRSQFACGDYPIISILSESLGGSGHAVRPYKWDSSKKPWTIFVANPNNPPPETGADPQNIIQIDPDKNTFRFAFGNSDIWTGGAWSGGRMFSIPFSQMCYWPRTPFWETIAALIGATLIILAGDGESSQITDAEGNTFYEPNLPGGPKKWEHVRKDAIKRIPHMARIPFIHGAGAGIRPELYMRRGGGGDIIHAINGKGAGPYKWGIRTLGMSATVSVPAHAGMVDSLKVENANTPNQTVSLTLAPKSKQRLASMSVTGYAANDAQAKVFDLSKINLPPGVALRARLMDGGQELRIENPGPELTMDVRMQSGPNKSAVLSKQSVKLDAGKTVSLRPADWEPIKLMKAPLRMAVLDAMEGKELRRVDL